ncbi:MAG: hypothetical protein ACHP9T_15990 [Caulobacterales bacterium]
MKLKTIGLAFVATAFLAGSALAQSGTMQPIPNPPEKAKMMKHHKKHMTKAMAAKDKSEDKAEAAEDKTKK